MLPGSSSGGFRQHWNEGSAAREEHWLRGGGLTPPETSVPSGLCVQVHLLSVHSGESVWECPRCPNNDNDSNNNLYLFGLRLAQVHVCQPVGWALFSPFHRQEKLRSGEGTHQLAQGQATSVWQAASGTSESALYTDRTETTQHTAPCSSRGATLVLRLQDAQDMGSLFPWKGHPWIGHPQSRLSAPDSQPRSYWYISQDQDVFPEPNCRKESESKLLSLWATQKLSKWKKARQWVFI